MNLLKRKLKFLLFLFLVSSNVSNASLLKYSVESDEYLDGYFLFDSVTKEIPKVNLSFHTDSQFYSENNYSLIFNVKSLVFTDPQSEIAAFSYYRYAMGGSGKGFEDIQNFNINLTAINLNSNLNQVLLAWNFSSQLLVHYGFDCNPDAETFQCTSFEYSTPLPDVVADRDNADHWHTPINEMRISRFAISAVPESEFFSMHIFGLLLVGFVTRKKY